MMGKPVTNEQKSRVVSLWYMGLTRDEIAEKTGLGKGTISNILQEFKEKMQKGDFEAIQTHARLNRDLGLDHANMLEGHRTNQILENNGLTQEKINSFLENLSKIPNSEDILALLKAAVEVLHQKEKTGHSIEETSNTYIHQSKAIPELDEKIKSKSQYIKELDHTIQKKLDDANTTQEILDLFEKATSKLEKVGLSILDFVKAPGVLVEFARHNFDPVKIVKFFDHVRDLSKTAKTYETKIHNLQKEISAKENNCIDVTSKLESLESKYKNYSKAIKILEAFVESNQDPNIIIQWEEILKESGIDISTFDKKLKEYKGITEILKTLKDELKNLDSQKQQLVDDINSLSKILQELQNHKNNLEKQINQLLKQASDEVSKFENSNPLRLVRDPHVETHKIRWIVLLFLKELKKSALVLEDNHSSSIQSRLGSLISDFERGG